MTGSATVGSPADRRWPLVGRDRDLDAALHAIEAGARLVSVHGPSGVGKSRFLAALADRLRDGGAVTIEAQGSAILGVVPLGALSGHLPGLSPYDGTAHDPALLFAEASAGIARAAAGRPVTLVVDDASLLDSASMILVAQLAAAGRVRLAVGLRPNAPLPEVLVGIWNAARDLRVDLAPLDLDQCRRLIETTLDGPVAHQTLTTLGTASGGSPLFLRELVLGTLENGLLQRDSGPWRLVGAPSTTPTLRELVLARFAGLDASARQTLDRLAVCGPLRPDQLPGDGVRRTLAALEEAGLVTVRDDTVALAEPVYATVLTESMSQLRRADLLAEQARLLTAAAGEEADLVQATVWQLEAGIPARPDVVRAAARYAAGVGDHVLVRRLTRAGLRTAPDDAELLLLDADAALRLGRADEALAILGRHRAGSTAPEAVPDADPAADLDEKVTIEAGRLAALAHLHRSDPAAALEALEATAARLGSPSASIELARASVLVDLGRMAEGEQVAAAVADLLEDSEESRARVAHARAIALVCLGRDEEALAAARDAADFAEQFDGRVLGLCRAETGLTLATVLHATGHYDDARRHAVRALADAAETGDEILTRKIELVLGWLALDAGHLDAAERWLAEMIGAARTVGPVGLADLAQLALATRHALAGDADEARRIFADVAHSPAAPLTGAVIDALAPPAGAAGSGSDPLAVISAVAQGATSIGHLAYAGSAWRAALELGEAEAAAGPLRELAATTGSPFLGLLSDHADAAAARDPDRLLALADVWEARGGLRLAAHAAATAAAARGSARTAAAAGARARDLATRCGGLSLPALAALADTTSPLTPREREIAALAAAGSTSKRIAEKLYLSSRTVDNHLQSVYTKLGISGRAELRASYRT